MTASASPETSTETSYDVCVVGGGPAGLALAVQLVRDGHRVVVLEQSRKFDRSFRGESMSPDGVWLLDRLGLLEQIEERGALTVERLQVSEGSRVVLSAEFADLPYAHRYPMEIPQPTLLAVLAAAAQEHDGFELRRGTKVTELVEDGGRVTGVRCTGPDGPAEVRAELVVAADGRYSRMRDLSGLPYVQTPLDRDVVWLRMPRPDSWDPAAYRIRLQGARHGLFIPTHPDDLRVGFNIPKGGLKELRTAGIGELHRTLDGIAPELSETVREHVTGWAGTTVLDIFTVDAARWSRPGLVLLGDAAHTLTPILGQGVNHALVDGVTLGELLHRPLQAAGERRHELVTTALLRFEDERRPRVRRSRSLQLRQERAFTIGHRAGVAARSAMYRAVHRSEFLRRSTLHKAYFQLQPVQAA